MGSFTKWLLGVFSGVVIAVAVDLLTPSKSFLFAAWGWLILLVQNFWAWAWSTTAIFNWIWYSAVIILLLMLVKAIGVTISKNRTPHWMEYTEDVFDGVVWRWKHTSRGISRLVPYCPSCDQMMVYDEPHHRLSEQLYLVCERHLENRHEMPCRSYSGLERMIERRIDVNIRNGRWSKS